MKDKKEEIKVRQAFTFYLSFEEGLEDLPEADQFTLYKAISRYSLFGEEPELSGIARSLWRLMFPTLHRQRRGFENGLKGAEFGHIGGAPKGNQNARKYPQNNPQNNPTITITETKKEELKAVKRAAFIPPTLDEVRAYFREKGYREDVGERAFNYYNESNWHNKDGKPIKNWKQTMIGVWFKDDNKEKQQTNGTQKKRHEFTA